MKKRNNIPVNLPMQLKCLKHSVMPLLRRRRIPIEIKNIDHLEMIVLDHVRRIVVAIIIDIIETIVPIGIDLIDIIVVVHHVKIVDDITIDHAHVHLTIDIEIIDVIVRRESKIIQLFSIFNKPELCSREKESELFYYYHSCCFLLVLLLFSFFLYVNTNIISAKRSFLTSDVSAEF